MPKGVYVRTKKVIPWNKGKILPSWSEEAKQKLSIARIGNTNAAGNKGKPHSPEHIRNSALAHVGMRHSEETKERIRQFNLGKKLSPETCKKISEISKGRVPSIETRRKMSSSQMGHRRGLGRHPNVETRRLLSLNAIKMIQEGRFGYDTYKARWWVDRLGRKMFLRSSWELQFAQWLDSELLTWDYQVCVSDIGEQYHRLPDFYIKEWDSFVEIKPWEYRDQAYDLKRLLECVHGKKCLIVMGEELKDLDAWCIRESLK